MLLHKCSVSKVKKEISQVAKKINNIGTEVEGTYFVLLKFL